MEGTVRNWELGRDISRRSFDLVKQVKPENPLFWHKLKATHHVHACCKQHNLSPYWADPRVLHVLIILLCFCHMLYYDWLQLVYRAILPLASTASWHDQALYHLWYLELQHLEHHFELKNGILDSNRRVSMSHLGSLRWVSFTCSIQLLQQHLSKRLNDVSLSFFEG